MTVIDHWTDDKQASIDSQVPADNRVYSSSPSQRSQHGVITPRFTACE